MKVRIIRGIYGFRQDGNVVEKTSSSAPFEVNDDEGERLISLHVAEKVGSVVMTPEPPSEEQLPHSDEETDMLDRMALISKESLKGRNKEELLKFAEALGIKKSGSKDELAERLAKCPVWAEDAEVQDEEEEPDLFAEDPE